MQVIESDHARNQKVPKRKDLSLVGHKGGGSELKTLDFGWMALETLWDDKELPPDERQGREVAS